MPGLAVETVASEAGGGVNLCGHVERRYITAEECQQTATNFSDAVRAELQGGDASQRTKYPWQWDVGDCTAGIIWKGIIAGIELEQED